MHGIFGSNSFSLGGKIMEEIAKIKVFYNDGTVEEYIGEWVYQELYIEILQYEMMIVIPYSSIKKIEFSN